VIIGLVGGFGIGRIANRSTKTTPQKPLVTPAQISAAAAATGHGTVNDRGFSKLENGVQHNHAFQLPVSPADQVTLSHQMDLTRQVALEFPTLADAERAGLRRAGPFSPGLGTHMINFGAMQLVGDGPITDDQIRHPLAWIYDGTKPTSRVTGLFYMSFAQNPTGFAGPNDVWHKHHNICTVYTKQGIDAPLGADGDVTKAQCDAVHGTLLKATPALLHVWTVPGYEDSQGVFAHLNPAITCTDGSYKTIDTTKTGARVTVCADQSE
jgi:hypothetical protein